MGSLMAGWDSPVRDSKSVTYLRNNSCTNEEIEAYWKSKEPVFEKENYARRVIDQENTSKKQSGNTGKRQRSSSLPPMDKLIKANSWWSRSNCAFLNEPPVIATTDPEGRALFRYLPQYHVATGFGSSKPEDIVPE